MAPIDVVNDAEETPPGSGEAQTASASAVPDLGEDVDPTPIGDPDEEEGYDDEDDDEEEEEDEEEPLQLLRPSSTNRAIARSDR